VVNHETAAFEKKPEKKEVSDGEADVFWAGRGRERETK